MHVFGKNLRQYAVENDNNAVGDAVFYFLRQYASRIIFYGITASRKCRYCRKKSALFSFYGSPRGSIFYGSTLIFYGSPWSTFSFSTALTAVKNARCAFFTALTAVENALSSILTGVRRIHTFVIFTAVPQLSTAVLPHTHSGDPQDCRRKSHDCRRICVRALRARALAVHVTEVGC